jgi:hypothetical protein
MQPMNQVVAREKGRRTASSGQAWNLHAVRDVDATALGVRLQDGRGAAGADCRRPRWLGGVLDFEPVPRLMQRAEVAMIQSFLRIGCGDEYDASTRNSVACFKTQKFK